MQRYKSLIALEKSVKLKDYTLLTNIIEFQISTNC